jgi:ribonucleoside-diphosphate reductase alpha chain
MDCDTTGIEPDFALVKFKKLAGGGFFKIVNQSVPRALKSLGYTERQAKEVVEYAIGTMSLETSPYINRETLRAKGLTDQDLLKVTSALQSAFDISAAVAPWVIGEEGLTRLGLTPETLAGRSILAALGFSEAQVRAASEVACGRMTVEGAPHLKPQHLSVFDCANKCGEDGTRFIAPLAHVRMMAAAQPFLSGAISKTVNMPAESTAQDIEGIYEASWRLGLKAVAVYRDGSKVAQPLSGKGEKKKEAAAVPADPVNARGERLEYSQKDLEEAVARAIAKAPARKRKMPQKRHGITVETRVGGHQIFLRTGEYADGKLGEIFIDMHKEGATLRSLLNCFAISVSMGLQSGVPLESYVDKFSFTRFEPQGMVDHPNIKTATSLLDYVFRLLGMEYLGKTDFVHVKPELERLAMNRLELAEPAAQAPAPAQAAQAKPQQEAAPPMLFAEKAKYSAMGLAADPLDAQLSKMMGDAPMCSACGHVTVRNGSCYRCLNCGSSMGCS